MKYLSILLGCAFIYSNNVQAQEPEKGAYVKRQEQPRFTPPVIRSLPINANDPEVTDPNPAHGQPNHRCDIPVGASLSTKVEKVPNNYMNNIGYEVNAQKNDEEINKQVGEIKSAAQKKADEIKREAEK